ncbi:hypothetical protein BN59_01124 [Legionella massiliensis]|uniref:Uncharacterized protein n=1 Tax=Legionella massiliensis TaxID=1034943 RepID=A0A078KYN9_9GAMM|nr:hypothetical protein [Legionella massiliensis]CDZ76848.1 hypothetical protein BN59_01124 [Legionella massiliensis]CEE12586.1 hypothetical protein BN1094_01124 [Legionella massiliensis]
MKEDDFRLKISGLIASSGSNQLFFVNGMKELFAQGLPHLTKSFLLASTIQSVVEQQPEISNENLCDLICELVSFLEDPKECLEITTKLRQTLQLLKIYDEQGIAAYLGINVVIFATNENFFKIFKFRRTANYELYIDPKYNLNTQLEMLQLDAVIPHQSKNCWVIPIADPSSSGEVKLVKIYPAWSTLLLTNSGQIANQFYKGNVSDQSMQTRLDKRRGNTQKTIDNFISGLQSTDKKQKIPDINSHINIIRGEANNNSDQFSVLNLLDSFALLVELGGVLHKKIVSHFNIDAKTLKSKNTILATILVQLFKDAICSNYHDDLKVTLEISGNEVVFSLLATPNQFFSAPSVYDHNTKGVFATPNYISRIQKLINGVDIELILNGRQGITLKTALANIELRADHFGLYPNSLTESATVDRSKIDFKSKILNVDSDNPLEPSLFDQTRGELCALIIKLEIRKEESKKPSAEESTPVLILEQLDSLSSKLKTRSVTPQRKLTNNVEPLSMPLKKGLRRNTATSFFTFTREEPSCALKSNSTSLDSSSDPDLLSNSGTINKVTALINSVVPYLLAPEKLAEYAALTQQPNKPISQLIEILKTIDQQLQENNTNRNYHRKLHELISRLLQIYVDFSEHSQDFFHNAQPKALITGPLIGACTIEPALAFHLLGLSPRGERVWSEYPGASHPVTQRQGIHYKAERSLGTDNGLGTGLEQFIHTFLKEFSPQHWQSMVTPITPLRISNLFKPDHSEIEPQYLNASLSVPGVTLANWLVLKEWTETIASRGGKASLLKAVKQWITKEYYRRDQTVDDMIEEIIKNHLTIDSPNRLRDFAEAPKGADPSDRLRGSFKRILADYGEEKCRLICSFIHHWPELVSGFELFEVAKWIPSFSKLPEYFLNIPPDKINLIVKNEAALENVVNKIYEQLDNFWKLLNTPSALSLALGCYLFGFEDGNGDNFQVEIIKKKIEEKGEPWYIIDEWRIVLIDVGLQAFENQVLIDKSKHRAGIKCILFLLGQIQQSILADNIQLNGSLELLILRCLEAAKIQNDDYTKLQQMELFHPPKSDLGFPLRLPANALSELYISLQQLKSFLESHPKGTWKDYFSLSSPLLAKGYEIARQQYPGSTLKAYLKISKTPLEDILPNKEAFVISISQLRALTHERPHDSSEEKPRNSQSLLSLWKPSSKKTTSTKKTCETYGEALAMCVRRSRIYEKTDMEQALCELLKVFPWNDGILMTYSWLNMIVKIYPQLCFYQLKVANYSLSSQLLECAVAKGNSEVALWLDKNNVLAITDDSRKTIEEMRREDDIKQDMRLHRFESDRSLSLRDQLEVEHITLLAYQSWEEFYEAFKPLEPTIKLAILNSLNWARLPKLSYLEQRQATKIAKLCRFTRVFINGEFQNEDILVQIIKDSEIQELTIANSKSLTMAKLRKILAACQNKLISLTLHNLSNINGCLGNEHSEGLSFPLLIKLEVIKLPVQSIYMTMPRLRELSLSSCDALTTFPIKRKPKFIEIKDCDRLKENTLESEESSLYITSPN